MSWDPSFPNFVFSSTENCSDALTPRLRRVSADTAYVRILFQFLCSRKIHFGVWKRAYLSSHVWGIIDCLFYSRTQATRSFDRNKRKQIAIFELNELPRSLATLFLFGSSPKIPFVPPMNAGLPIHNTILHSVHITWPLAQRSF